MVKIILMSSLLVLVTACGSRELNLNALDLNRYTTNLSESQDKFPAYVKLMTPDHTGVVPSQVAEIIKFFEDKSQPKQLFLIGETGTEVDARVQAMALHDKSTRLIEIRTDKLAEDQKAQAWTPAEYERVLDAVLKQNNAHDVIFVVSSSLPISTVYRVIFMNVKATSGHDFQPSFVPLPELITYAEALGKEKGFSLEEVQKASLLLFVFVHHGNFFQSLETVLEKSLKQVGSKEPMLDAVFAHFQTRHVLGKKNFDLKQKMRLFANEPSHYTSEKLQEISDSVHEHADAFSDESSKRTDDLLEMILQQDSTLDKIREQIGLLRFSDE